jgi:hypothetical protein
VWTRHLLGAFAPGGREDAEGGCGTSEDGGGLDGEGEAMGEKTQCKKKAEHCARTRQ